MSLGASTSGAQPSVCRNLLVPRNGLRIDLPVLCRSAKMPPVLKAPKLFLIPGAGAEIVDFAGLSGTSYRKTHWKRWGASPPTFSDLFYSKRGRLDSQNRRFPARPAPWDKDKFWSSQSL